MLRNMLRFWHKEDKEFIVPSHKGWIYEATNGQMYADGMNVTNRIEIIRYTGLKDKNDKAICEGDNVKGLKRGYDDEWHTVKVFEHNGCFMFGVWNAHEFFNRFQLIEIIGNEFENPNLTKEQNK